MELSSRWCRAGVRLAAATVLPIALQACGTLGTGAGDVVAVDATSADVPRTGSAPPRAPGIDATRPDAPRAAVPASGAAIDEPSSERAPTRPSTDASAATVPGDTPMPADTRDLWDRIRAGFAMPELRSPLVQQRVRWYVARPDLLSAMFERGTPYLHFIVEEIVRRGLPTELALLPFVESAMDPSALSPARAAGLWQFIPGTGRRFDLSQDWWIDQRRDVVESTHAALDYLELVYAMHGRDWFLALASYNWGEGAVARAVRSNRRQGRPAGYADLRMPRETRHYVPKLLALRHIVANAAALGIALPALPDRPYFASVAHRVPMDMKLAARFARMTEAEFVALNPAHRRPVLAAHRQEEIRLPVDRVDGFLAAVQLHEQQRGGFVSWRPHTLAAGETLESVSLRAGADVGEVRRANGLPPMRRLRTGSQILVPAHQPVDPADVAGFDAPRFAFHAEPRARRVVASRASARGTARPQATATPRPAIRRERARR